LLAQWKHQQIDYSGVANPEFKAVPVFCAEVALDNGTAHTLKICSRQSSVGPHYAGYA